MNTLFVSVVIPVYNEKESLPTLLEEIRSSLSDSFNYEIICVDDGSTDGSYEYLKEAFNNGSSHKVIKFQKNYGKSAALTAGFNRVRGDVVVTLDSDLQDDPSEIPDMIGMLDEGYDMISGWKKNRYDPASKRWPSKFFNLTTKLLTGIRLHDFNCGLKVYRTNVVKSLDIYGGMHRFIPVMAGKNGFKVGEKIVNHRPRKFGKTKFGRERYFHGLFDLLTVLFLSQHTLRPLRLFGIFGILSMNAGVLVNVWVLYLKYSLGEPFSKHFALLVFGVMLLILGVQFISLGLLGEMIAQSNRRSAEVSQEIEE
tara:strand:- start:14230 stop:15162 length:933 start_codon:yes stop_codon:yes gene_type:complete